MKTLKAIAIMFVASLLVINLAIACGGMSPQPAPGDFDTDVPTLPGDDGLPGPGDDTTNGDDDDVTNDGDDSTTDNDNGAPHDCPFPGDVDTDGDDDDNNDGSDDVDSLPSDLPTPDSTNQNSDGQFVDVVL